jgi:uncharacterized protein YqjF (DUF2071 family)
MTDPSLTLHLRNQAPGKVALDMRWRNLLFLHFAYDPAAIQMLLPEGLTVDTYPDAAGQEMAWIGLVPFEMLSVHPRRLPRIRQCADFPETNVRTYCHVEGEGPGVWFFSLDAANPFACAVARRFYALNYQEARMSVNRINERVHYESRRWRPPRAGNSVHCVLAEETGPAEPGSLEFFLVERYLLYSWRRGVLFRGQVHHSPYRLRKVESFSAASDLLEANGLEPQPFSHAVFSDGVDVAAGRIERVVT